MSDLFPPIMTLDDQLAAIKREITMRERVYPRLVANGSLTQAKADHELAAMRAVLRTLTVIPSDAAIELKRAEILDLATVIEAGAKNRFFSMEAGVRGHRNNGVIASLDGWQWLRYHEFRSVDAGEVSRFAQMSLGLSKPEARALFAPEGWIDNRDAVGEFTRQRAAAVLRHLAETGVVSWVSFGEDGKQRNPT